MKYTDILVAAERRRVLSPRLVRRDAARTYVTAPQLFDLMEAAKWIKPVVQKNRMTLFDLRHLDECIDRLAQGEYPGGGLAPAAAEQFD